MKTRILALGLLSLSSLSAFASPLNWQDIHPSDVAILQQKLDLKTASGEAVTIPAESKVTVTDVTALDGLPVINAVLKLEKCENASLQSEMEMILPEGARANSEVGVMLLKECQLDIYIETKDYGGISFLKASE